MRKIISILLALGVILGLTLAAAPVAAQPCVCPPGSTNFPIADLLVPPNPVAFCAGQISDYDIGTGLALTTPQALISDTDKFSVDFPADTDLSAVTAADVSIITAWAPLPGVSPAAITVTGQHLEFVIPLAAFGVAVIPMGTAYQLHVDNVLNPTVSATYCLYVDFCDDAICTPVQFDCSTYFVAPAQKIVDFHFDFGLTYAGIAEDYIPAFQACGMPGWGTLIAPDWYTDFTLILRDENGGCSDPCTTPSKFWFEVTKCPPGETINFIFDAPSAHCAAVTYALTDADIGLEKSLMACWAGWPPPDVTWDCQIHFSSPGDYELEFFLECPAGGCPLCGGPTIVAQKPLAASAYQYLEAFKIPLEDKWNLVSLPLFPIDTSIEHVLGSMDDISQLVSVWYFGQCEDPAPDLGVWHTSTYDPVAGTFTGDLTDIKTGKAYWIRTLHPGETGYVAGAVGFWVFGTYSIMPDSPGMDMGYFDVCEGWNMVGFKPPWNLVPSPHVPMLQLDNTFVPGGYLWNFNWGPFDVKYGLIYQWVPAPLPGNWVTYLPGALNMVPGEGYWIPFDGDDKIYPTA